MFRKDKMLMNLSVIVPVSRYYLKVIYTAHH